MNKLLIVYWGILTLASSCSKCYDCEQYCAYCVADNNTGISYKFCSTRDNTRAQVDSFYYSFPDSTFTCVKLQDERKVCDGKNGIDDAISYYLKQDYYCNPAE
ncbi:MAG: hypothetical protein IPN22_13370 [Bacteroidetes bacterium]|nr:hypothetical protein [Bacteroidota bacterium]